VKHFRTENFTKFLQHQLQHSFVTQFIHIYSHQTDYLFGANWYTFT